MCQCQSEKNCFNRWQHHIDPTNGYPGLLEPKSAQQMDRPGFGWRRRPDSLATAVTRPYPTWFLSLGLHQNKRLHLPNAKRSDTTQTKDHSNLWLKKSPLLPWKKCGVILKEDWWIQIKEKENILSILNFKLQSIKLNWSTMKNTLFAFLSYVFSENLKKFTFI